MHDLLLTPGAPWFALAVAAALVAALAEAQRRPVTALARPAPGRLPGGTPLQPLTPAQLRARLVIGQALTAPLVALLLLSAAAANLQGVAWLLVLGLALALLLAGGWVLPRRPWVVAQQRRRRLRALTPGLIAYIRVALAGYDPPATLLERYLTLADRQRQPMAELLQAALLVMHRERRRPFEALALVARQHAPQELIDVAEALAQAEREGGDPGQVLMAHEQTLLAILDDEFKRMLKRRTLVLLVLVAISVVVGILGNLLYVMIGSVLLGGGLA